MRWLMLCTAMALPMATGCVREAWLTPMGPARSSLAPSCTVASLAAPEPGTQTIGVVRCTDGLFGVGKGCWELVHERACEVGANVIFGAHYESDDPVASVGTIGPGGVHRSTAWRAGRFGYA